MTGEPALTPHLKVLHTIAQAMSRSLDVDETLRVAVDALTHVTGHEVSSLHLISPDGTTLHLRGERGLSPRLREVNRELPVGRGLIGGVAASGRALHVANVLERPDLFPSARDAVAEDRMRGFVCVPIQTGGRILGTLSLGRRTPEPFSEAEIALVEAAATQIAVALENARLYSETRRQLDDLQHAEAQLMAGEKLSTVAKLAAGVVHEINNPLTAILGQSELLMTRGNLTPADRERLSLIIQETSRAARMLRNLLQFSRDYPPERRPCSLADQVRLALELNEYQLHRGGIDVEVDLAPIPPVWADEHQIQQVLVNVIQNARQALESRPRPRRLELVLRAQEGAARLEVRDNGPGIAPELLPRIFDAFVTTKPAGEGTGLGLWVSYAIVEKHGGRLRAENRPEGGATFIVELPYRRETGAA
jgi:signal transduction histidine kinase